MGEIIRLEHVSKKFGGLVAVDDFSGEIETGSIVGLIGPNGAGKTTLFNMMSCTYPPTSGKIFYKGVDVTKARTDTMAARGLARTFQVTKPFGDMTVVENFMVGAFLHTKDRATARKQAEEIYDYIGMSCGRDKPANKQRRSIEKSWRSGARSRPSRNCCCWTRSWRAATAGKAGARGDLPEDSKMRHHAGGHRARHQDDHDALRKDRDSASRRKAHGRHAGTGCKRSSRDQRVFGGGLPCWMLKNFMPDTAISKSFTESL
jgi:ABC-type glutathione transport system ATPase component